MIDPKMIPDEAWRKVQQLTGQPEAMCRLITASALNAWPGAWAVPMYSDPKTMLHLPLTTEPST